jgi:hypothetical protein
MSPLDMEGLPRSRPAPPPPFAALRPDLDSALGWAEPDRLALLVGAYLGFPGALFLATWALPWVGLPLAAAGLAALLLAPGWRSVWPLAPGMTALCLALGLAWALPAGALHLFYATADWQVRDAVLRDLALHPWPLGYEHARDGADYLLRAPLGYFLPAGLVGQFGGFRAAQWALWAWTGLGLGLVLEPNRPDWNRMGFRHGSPM